MLIFLAGRHFFIRKMKIKMADSKKHVLSKPVKNIIFQNKPLLVMFYRHNKTFWYQFCNFKHFLKAENSEDSLASSCVDFSIGLSCNPVWDWVVPMVTALLLRTVTRGLTEQQCTYEPTKNFIINFMFSNAWKLLKIMLKYLYLCLSLSSIQKGYFFFGCKALFH